MDPKLPEKVTPTIQGRDFVIATVASPTVVVEPEKPSEEVAAEGELATAVKEDGTPSPEGEEKTDEKDKKPTENKKDPVKK